MIDPEPQIFHPSRFSGLIFQGLILVLLAASCILVLWQISNEQFGITFLISLLPILLSFLLVPFFLYRIQSLRKSIYVLERDGFRLQWGLRQEVIPMNEVLYVRSLQDFGRPLPLPWMRWPGSVVGQQALPEGTLVEYMASSSTGLILIAASSRIYAISPEDPEAFLAAYQRIMELGSLTPLSPVSVYPSFLLGRFWADRPARILLISGAVLNLLLLVWVSLVIPTRPEIFLRANLDNTGAVPSVHLLLLPFLCTAFFIGDLLLGLYLYRRDESRNVRQGIDTALAYLLWGSAALVPLLFLGAMVLILRTS
jgi:hypothetical protein